jgi:hypothetical protein
MKLLLLFIKFLPVVIDVVLAVEKIAAQATTAPTGETKEQIAIGLVNAVADATGHTIPEDQLKRLIGGIVGVFNVTGVFKTSEVKP